MSSKESVSLTIEGDPGEQLQVRWKGNPQEEEGDPSPIVWDGALGHDGRVTIEVPRAYLVIRGPRGTLPLPLHEEPGITSKTVRLDDLASI